MGRVTPTACTAISQLGSSSGSPKSELICRSAAALEGKGISGGPNTVRIYADADALGGPVLATGSITAPIADRLPRPEGGCDCAEGRPVMSVMHAAAVTALRHHLGLMLTALPGMVGLSLVDIDVTVLLLSEVCANALQHNAGIGNSKALDRSRSTHQRITLTVELLGTEPVVRVEVRDPGQGRSTEMAVAHAWPEIGGNAHA